MNACSAHEDNPLTVFESLLDLTRQLSYLDPKTQSGQWERVLAQREERLAQAGRIDLEGLPPERREALRALMSRVNEMEAAISAMLTETMGSLDNQLKSIWKARETLSHYSMPEETSGVWTGEA